MDILGLMNDTPTTQDAQAAKLRSDAAKIQADILADKVRTRINMGNYLERLLNTDISNRSSIDPRFVKVVTLK